MMALEALLGIELGKIQNSAPKFKNADEKYGTSVENNSKEDPKKWSVDFWQRSDGWWEWALRYDGRLQGTSGTAKEKKDALESARKLLKEARDGGYVP